MKSKNLRTKFYVYHRPAVKNHRGHIVGLEIKVLVKVLAIADGYYMVRPAFDRIDSTNRYLPFVCLGNELREIKTLKTKKK